MKKNLAPYNSNLDVFREVYRTCNHNKKSVIVSDNIDTDSLFGVYRDVMNLFITKNLLVVRTYDTLTDDDLLYAEIFEL